MGFGMLRGLAPLVSILLLVWIAGVAIGHHGGRPIGSLFNCDRPGVFPPRCTSVADDLDHTVFFDSTLTGGLADAMRDTLAEDYDPTDLNASEVTELTSDTDVIAYSQDYGDLGAAAWVYCPTDAPQSRNADGDRWCRGQELHFNLNARYAIFFADDASLDHVACHEMGHTVGLRHWGNPPQSDGPPGATCMNANTPNGPTELHQFDIDHINAYHYVAPPPSRRLQLVRAPAGPIGLLGQDPRLEGLQVESYDSLGEMAREADAVVRGTVIAVQPGRTFGDPAGAPLHYAAATIRVTDVLVGALRDDDAAELTLEVPLFDGPASLGEVEASLAGGEGVFFLRNKAESARRAGLSPSEQQMDAGYYRLVVFGAVIGNDAGVAGAGADEGGVLSALDGMPFVSAVRQIRDAAAR